MQDLLTFKQAIHQQCLELVDERILQVQKQINDLREAAGESGKSSAGDKHETGRAMADLEVEKQQASLKNLLQMHATLTQIDPLQKRDRVAPGALIETDLGTFYIATAIGRIQVGEKEVLVISTDAPIIKALQKYPIISQVIFNGNMYVIQSVT